MNCVCHPSKGACIVYGLILNVSGCLCVDDDNPHGSKFNGIASQSASLSNASSPENGSGVNRDYRATVRACEFDLKIGKRGRHRCGSSQLYTDRKRTRLNSSHL